MLPAEAGRFTDPHLVAHTHMEALRKSHLPVKATAAADLYSRFTDTTDVNGFHDGPYALMALWDETPGFEGCDFMFRVFASDHVCQAHSAGTGCRPRQRHYG
jgi:hypothetical protein